MKLIFSVITLCFLSACGSSPTTTQAPASPSPVEGKKITSTGVVHATVKRINLAAGGSGEVIVSLNIDGGYHVNANPPTFSYLKATELVITPGEGFSASAVSYPAPVTKKFAFAEKPLAVYEGDAQLKATIKATAQAAPGDHSVPALLKVQACDDQVCYPPGQVDLQIPVTLK
jgi:DsbC/DsbD-like thiol-disulfide interchange protein